MKAVIEQKLHPTAKRLSTDDNAFYNVLTQEMINDLSYFKSLENEVDSLRSQLEIQKTQSSNEIDRLSREYYYADHMNAILGNCLTKKGITMAEPNLNDYISITRKNFLLDDNEGRMVKKSFLEIQGTFLATKVTTWEDLVEKFLQKFYQLSNNNDEIEADKDDNPDDIIKIFKIEGNLFDFETPLYEAFNKFNYLLKIDTYLFTFDIQEIRTYEEHEYELNNNMTKDLEEPWSEYGVPYQLCNNICKPYHFKNRKVKWPTCSSDIDEFCNGGELPEMVRVGCMTYF
ncbi:hypothetical protein Tco_1140362 [Tanacetum coccineum]